MSYKLKTAGEINDKFNKDFKSGNIEPGNLLSISNGLDPNEAKIRRDIRSVTNFLDSVSKQRDSFNGRIDFLATGARNEPMEPGLGSNTATSLLGGMLWGSDISRTTNEINSAQKQIDSLDNLLERMKNDKDQD